MSYQINCLNCKKTITTLDHRQKFCSLSCACSYNNKRKKPHTLKTKNKISDSLKKRFKKFGNSQKNSLIHSIAVGKKTRGRYKEQPPNSILKLSKRTVRKIFRRLKLPCSNCGWKKGVGDIHHINGKKIKNPNDHKNLTYICPNCHRLAHEHKIKKEKLINLEKYIKNKWKEFYYG